jgi:hypothetical protein
MMSSEFNETFPVSANGPAPIGLPIPESLAATWLAALQRAEIERVDASHANLLGWLMVLPCGVDPANAASAVLAQQQRLPQSVLSAELTQLLTQVVAFSKTRLAQMRRPRRRLHS